jgi:iron complex outermembrane recepter protein
MHTSRNAFWTGTLAFAGTIAFLLAGSNAVLAEQATTTKSGEKKSAETAELGEVIVTGTMLRGIAPTGANEITVSKEEITATGATSASQLLSTIPQLGGGGGVGNYFNSIPQVDPINSLAVGQNAQTQQRPSLRPTPGSSQDSGNSTLVLVNGNRVAGAGVNSNSPSGDAVPPALLERVELLTDGASAIYGSDAISGVINYVTVRKFNGVQATARVGFADSYHTWDANGIAGTEWGSGSAFISVGGSFASKLFNRDRSYVLPIDFTTGLERDLSCDTANVRVAANTAGSTSPLLHYYPSTATGVGTTPFTVVAPLIGTPNVCRLNRDATLGSEAKRNNVLASLALDRGPVKLTFRGHYDYNASSSNRQMATYTALINNKNPYWRPLPGEPNVTSYSVLGNYANALGGETYVYDNSTTQYGATADISWDVGSNWQVRGTAVYDKSDSDLYIPQITAANQNAGFNTNAAAACSVQGTTAACLNPFDIASSNPALVSGLLTSEQIGEGHDQIWDFKVISDGPLFHIQGGDVHVAIGVEYYDDKFARGNYTGLVANAGNPATAPVPGLVVPSVSLSSKSIFAEVNIPFVSADNAKPLLHDFHVSASGRYDNYSTVGGTFNPRFGANYKPADWLNIRGSYNTSFRAPSAVDLIGQGYANSSVSSFPAGLTNGTAPIWLDPARPIPPSMGGPTSTTAMVLALQGTDPNLQPQTGKGYSFAMEFTPVPHLFVSLNYYRTDYKLQFSSPCQSVPCFPYLPQYEIVFPTPAQIAQFKTLGVGGTNITTPDDQVYGLVDTRKTNLGNSFIRGMDYAVRYSVPTGFGSVFGSLSGNYQLDSQSQPAPGLPYVDNFVTFPQTRHKMIVQLGATAGGLWVTGTLQHSAGYSVARSAILLQDAVGAYDVINLAATYSFEGDGSIEKGLQLTLTMNNAFNEEPPILRQTGSVGYANGSTLGRVAIVGFTKKF